MAFLNIIRFIRGPERIRGGLTRKHQPFSHYLRPPRVMSQFLFHRLAVSLLLAAPWWTSAAESATSPEYQVKAVFLSKFPSFVTWPDNVFSEAKAPIVIGILGSNPFGAVLEEAIREVEIKGRPLTIRKIERVEEAAGCQILYIREQERERLSRILDALKNKPVFTVGETDQFTRRGGILNFTLVEGRVRIEINPDEAHRAGLKIDSKLLSVATVVK